jgi:diacylglycerol kinase family enzyme
LLTVVLNPASGGSSKVEPQRLVELFRADGVEMRIVTLELARAEAIIREAVAQSGDIVVAAGGDGTVSSVAAAVAGKNITLGVLPFGTLNHFAKDLHIPLDAAAAVKTIVARHVISVDVGYVNQRAFINNSSIGVYPDIVERRETLRRQGHNKWTALAIATANVVRRGREVFVRVDVDGRHAVTRTPFLFVGNNEYTIEGLNPGTRARLDGGRLYAYLAPRLHTRDLPKAVLWALLGRGGTPGPFSVITAAEMWIETPRNRTIHVATDGEVTTLPTPLHYRMAAGALKVIVPAG